MKCRTLITITAALITCAAVVLSMGLSLLHGSAFNEATADEIPVATNDEIIEEIIGGDTNEESEIADSEVTVQPEEPKDEGEKDVTENTTDTPEAVTPKYDYPDFEYNVVDAKDMHYCGCDQSEPHCSHYELLRGVTIDVYSHKTGELVGQIALESAEIENYISELVAEEFNPWAETFNPNSDDKAINLPKGDYRIEVYSGTWFSYTYGNDSMFELTQCALTFYGGEKMIGYIDYLIADYIAEIEAGKIEKPNPEMAVSKLEFPGLEGYWEGYYNEVLKEWIPAAGRYTERFPYLED